MQLYLMRHALAEDQAPTGRDQDRQLTPAGRAIAREVARELQRLDVLPARILSSPFRRCAQTAEELIAILNPGLELELRPELAPGVAGSAVLAELMGAKASKVMIIGHEPDLSQLTAGLLPHWGHGYDKAMVAALRIDVGDGLGDRFAYPDAQLQFLLDPNALSLSR